MGTLSTLRRSTHQRSTHQRRVVSATLVATTLVAAALIGSAVIAAPCAVAASAAEAADASMRLEARLEQARKQLDEAARKLGELHSEMWRLETAGPHADRPILGVVIDDSGDLDAGMQVVGVSPGGGAEQAGLRAGDRLVMVNEVRLDSGGGRKPLHLFSEAMWSVQAGDSVPVVYVRDGGTHRAEVVTQPRATHMARVVEERSDWLEGVQALARLESLQALEKLGTMDGVDLDTSGSVVRVPVGLRLEDVTGELAAYFDVEQGVLVLEAPDRQPALKAGDILLSVDGTPAENADALLVRLGELEGPVPAEVKRRGRVRELSLDADALNAEQAIQVIGGERRIRIWRGDDDQVEIVLGE